MVYKESPAIKGGSDEINAIAHGVEAKLNSLAGFSEMVTQQSVEIARQLGMSEEEIQRWATTRSMLDSQRSRAVYSSLDKVGKKVHSLRG